jgi:hypothetical protein
MALAGKKSKKKTPARIHVQGFFATSAEADPGILLQNLEFYHDIERFVRMGRNRVIIVCDPFFDCLNNG